VTQGSSQTVSGGDSPGKDAAATEADTKEQEPAPEHANAAMWTNPVVKNTCMFDPVGGSVSFYNSRVRLEPV
jgi:hypothetical protein